MVDPPNCVSDPQNSRLSGHADGPPNFPALFEALYNISPSASSSFYIRYNTAAQYYNKAKKQIYKMKQRLIKTRL